MSRSTIELSTKVRELRNDAQIALFQINKLTEENKRLRVALERIRDCASSAYYKGEWMTPTDSIDAMRQIAREALEL